MVDSAFGMVHNFNWYGTFPVWQFHPFWYRKFPHWYGTFNLDPLFLISSRFILIALHLIEYLAFDVERKYVIFELFI